MWEEWQPKILTKLTRRKAPPRAVCQIKLPEPSPEQKDYLGVLKDAGKGYDPNTIIGK